LTASHCIEPEKLRMAFGVPPLDSRHDGHERAGGVGNCAAHGRRNSKQTLQATAAAAAA
jgi:hypothetical protein